MSTEAFRFRSDLEHARYDIKGMSLIARDGEVGSVDDVVETAGGYVVLVNAGPFGFGRSRSVPAGLITDIDQDEQVVRVDASAAQVKEAPKFDDDVSDDSVLERELLEHFEGAAAVPEPFEGDTRELPQRDEGYETVPPLVAGPFASTEPAAPQRDDEAREDMADIAPTAPSSPSTVGLGTSVRADTEAPDVSAAPAAADRPPTSGEPMSVLPDAPAASETTEAPDVGTDTASTPVETRPSETDPASAIDGPEASPSRDSERGETTARESSRTPRRKSSSGAPKRDGRGSMPIARYDSLNAGEILPKLRGLSQSELTQVERYERKHQSRKTLLERIEALRSDQPWRGYDTQKVVDVQKKLAKAEPQTARFVRDYERKHKDRSGVVQAAQRRLEEA